MKYKRLPTEDNDSIDEVTKNKKYSPIYCQYLLLTVTLSMTGSVIFFLDHITYEEDYTKEFQFKNIVNYTIKTEGCSIPGMEPFDDSVKKYYKPIVGVDRKRWECKNKDRPLLKRNRTHLWITDNLGVYNITSNRDFYCCTKKFYRPVSVDNVWSSRIDERVKYDSCVNFTNAVEIKHDFVEVFCYVKQAKVYSNIYLFAPNKTVRLYDGKALNKSKPAYNVVVLGIDNVSRLNFHRTMPKTLKYLQSKDVVELLGYTKVGSNSYPNIVAMLTGLQAYGELNKLCYPYSRATFDFCPFVWTWFKQAGYYTALGEDTNQLGTFTYLADGFFRSPTDFYMHPFTTVAGGGGCVKEKYYFEILLEYFEDILHVVESVRSKMFGFFWSVSLTHDNLNAPTLMDDGYLKFFTRIEAKGYLNSTVIFLVSDHGMRHGGIRGTKQGRLEERLPFVFILTPTSFSHNYSQALNNLKDNSHRLTSPYDVYATLNDLIDLENLKNNKITSRIKEGYTKKRGLSLFLPIPGNRTCKDAGISDEWCSCVKGNKLPQKTKEAGHAANFILQELNEILRPYSQCAKLTLDKIVSANELVSGVPEKGEAGLREFLVVVQVRPSGGLFEAFLRFDGKHWKLAGHINRVNRYGDQSRCVFLPMLRLYCFCI